MAGRSIETPAYVDFAKRIIRGAGKRVAVGDEWELGELISLRDEVEEAIDTAVAGLREQGHSWAYIADGLGVTRQSAYERYSKRLAS
jgi:hypothetical protein